MGTSRFQEGTTSLEDLVFGGFIHSISAWDFRRGILSPRYIIQLSLDSFGGFLQLGQIIEGFSLLLERGFSNWGFGIAYGLDLFLYSSFIVYSTSGGFHLLPGRFL